MKIAIVIVHYANRELTKQCLDSVLALRKEKFELETVVVNNNPEERMSDLKKGFPTIIFLEAGQNLGFTGGYNLGIKKSLEIGAEFVFIINNDTILDKDTVVELIKVARAELKAGIFGPKIYFALGREYHKERYKPSERGKVIWYAGGVINWNNVIASHRGVDEVDNGQYDKIQKTAFVSGCAMMVKTDVFKKIGFLDDKYFLYLEDNDFCQRAKRAGFELLYVPKAKVWHVNASSSEVGGGLQDYFLTRNRLLFGFNYAPFRTKMALTRESFKLLIRGRRWQKKGVIDFYFRRFGKGSYKI